MLRMGRVVVRRSDMLFMVIFLGIFITLLPVFVSRHELSLCPCDYSPAVFDRIISRPKRRANLAHERSDVAGISQDGSVGDSLEKKKLPEDWDRALNVRPTTRTPAEVKETPAWEHDKNTDNRLSQSAKNRSSNKSVICYTVDNLRNGSGLEKWNSLAKAIDAESASSLAKGNQNDAKSPFQRFLDQDVTADTRHPAPVETEHKRCQESAVETVIQSFLHDIVSKRDLRNIHLLTQLEWFGEDVLVKKNPAVFVVNKTRSPYTPAPTVLQGQESGCLGDPPFLLVLIPSVASHTTTRRAIRDTWAGPAYGKAWPMGVNITQKVKVVFVFGRTSDTETVMLFEEQSKFKDIVIADFKDTYQNLTTKMIVSLRWAATFCPGAKFVMKVDEDTFVNVPLTIEFLTLVSCRHDRFVMGYRNRRPIVLRYGKWKVETKDYPLSYFPDYVIGHSYVITGNVIRNMTEMASYVPTVPIEDAYVTGILAAILEVPRVHVHNFAETDRRLSPCDLVSGRYLSQTRFSERSLSSFWKYVSAGGCGQWA